jgi:hydroxymethylpyrimidine pyrophosphatase-like HAD family hydrolase
MHVMTLACDLDGTLTDNGVISPAIWAQLGRAKVIGWRLLLVTGRLFDTFTYNGPFVETFDAIIAEDGAVVYFPHRDIVTLPFGQLPDQLRVRLDALSISLEHGRAIVATHIPHDRAVLEVLRDTGGGATVEYNRGAVMVLPPGATKGTGLQYALRELGISRHNVIAIGDAENDRSLLSQAEVAVAVANATPELKAQADLVLEAPADAGVSSLIDQLLGGQLPRRRCRPERQLLLGQQADGTPLQLDPFTVLDGTIGIVGSSGAGKSWLAGLLAEALLQQGYQLMLIDPEGDYRALRAFPHTLLLGGEGGSLPPVPDVIMLSEYTEVSLVLDLSLTASEARQRYVTELLRELWCLRTGHGRPHWLLIDEIQNFCPHDGSEATGLLGKLIQQGGIGLVSYRPSQMASSLLTVTHNWLLTRLEWPEEQAVMAPLLQGESDWPALCDELRTLPRGQAYLCLGAGQGEGIKPQLLRFHATLRTVSHIRHLHKYLRAAQPREKRFYFHDSQSHFLGTVAANLWEFRQALATLPLESLQYHLQRGDFARWIAEVLSDRELARRINRLAHRSITGDALREALSATVRQRYDELDSLI